MTEYAEKLSAFLDGELPEDEARAVEAALAADPGLQAELEALMAADTVAKDAFDEMLDEPVPFALASAIQLAEASVVANDAPAPARRGGWLAAAVASVALALGGAGGYFTGVSQSTQVTAAPGWLADIADYHRVYSGQVRHLVEVGAEEADHIQTWLTATVGAPVRIPDLSQHGLTFEGGRLLVAAGKPVAQLMFTDADERVVALCLIQTDTPQDGFGNRTIGAFDMVTWGGESANFVVVGDEGRSDLDAIAQTAAVQA
ncbi:MAG: anti-sigma factor [Pseudomonadota bacterium]